MTRLGPSELPQEIIDEVIDLFSADKKTLITCSLVSRVWAYRTRKHLFSTLTLTDKTLPTWHSTVMRPTPNDGSGKRPVPRTTCPPSPSYPPSFLSSNVTSLKLAPTSNSQDTSDDFEQALLRASTHLSAFVNLNSLTLYKISLTAFWDLSLRACFGAFGETVCELKLLKCLLEEEVLTLLQLFTHLEALELDGNEWISNGLFEFNVSQEDPPVLRGSFTASNFTDADIRLLGHLLDFTTGVECHTITLGYNPVSTFGWLNTLFTRCKGHLKTLVLTAADSIPPVEVSNSGFDLSPCKKLVEIHVWLKSAEFALTIATLRTVSTRRFRKLTILITSRLPEITIRDWERLDEEISALAERVRATAWDDMMEVVICTYLTSLGDTQLSEIEGVLFLTSRNTSVTLRTEHLPPPHVPHMSCTPLSTLPVIPSLPESCSSWRPRRVVQHASSFLNVFRLRK